MKKIQLAAYFLICEILKRIVQNICTNVDSTNMKRIQYAKVSHL